jgi:hypothetical protein
MNYICLDSIRIFGLAGMLAVGAWAAEDKTPRRLESVTWSPTEHKLTWVISTGARDTAGKYKPARSQTYYIDMSAATMTLNNEGRRFSRDEAKNVQMLMDLISKYAVESTIWWDQGQGTPLGKDDKGDTEVNQPRSSPPRPVIPPRRPAEVIKISTNPGP